MVSGKILGLSTSLVVLVIAVAIVIRFGSSLNIGQRFNEGLEGASNSINSFFDNLLPSASAQTSANVEPLDLSQPDQGLPNPADAPTNPTPVDVILVDPAKTPEQKRQDIFDRIPVDQKKGTDGFDRVFREDGSEKFNPPNTIAFGFSQINDGKGVPDTPTNRKLVDDILSGQVFVGGTGFEGVDPKSGLFTHLSQLSPTIPVAFAEEIPKINSHPQNKIEKTNVGQQSINVKGESKGVKITGAFSSNGRFTQAVIRPTQIDRSKLLVDENKNPVETASQRANRIFQETNDFVDVNRGATKISNTKHANKNFGTNTGSGQRGSTEQDTKSNRQLLLQREAEKARRIFDAGSISNF